MELLSPDTEGARYIKCWGEVEGKEPMDVRTGRLVTGACYVALI